MPFETYVPSRGRGSSDKPTIRVTKNGQFSISAVAYEQLLNKANHVELLFDPRSGKVGLRPRGKATKASYKVRASPQGGNRRYVSAQKFLEHFGIEVKKASTFEVGWNKKERAAEFTTRTG